MKIRKVNLPDFVNAAVTLHKADIEFDQSELQALSLNGYSLENIAYGMVSAKKYGQILTLEQAKVADKKGLVLKDEIFKIVDNEK